MAQMAQKTLAIGDAERLPDPLPLLADRIQHHLPAQALLRRIRHIEADLAQALAQVALLIVAGPCCPRAAEVTARQQAVARKGDDTAAVAQPVQRRDRIGHG